MSFPAPPVPHAERRLSAGAAAWLIAGAAAAFAGFLAALAYQPELAASADKGAQALSRSPAGYAGIVRLLQADGATVRMNRRRDPGAGLDYGDLLVLTPLAVTPAAQIRGLARGRRVLLVPPKWALAPDPRRPGRVASAGTIPEAVAVAQIASVTEPAGRRAAGAVRLVTDPASAPVSISAPAAVVPGAGEVMTTPPVTGLRTLGGSALQPVRVDGAGRALVAMAVGPGRVAYVLSDADLIDNKGVADLAGARAAASLIETLAEGHPIVFDLTLPGLAGGRSPLKLAFEPPFAPAAVSFALAAVLLGLAAGARFGSVRTAGRAYGFGKRALADSAASLLAVAGREPRLAPRYAEIAREAAAAAAGLPDGSPAAAQALDRIGEARGAGSWSQIAAEAAAVRTRGQLMTLARRADAWRMEMTRGRG